MLISALVLSTNVPVFADYCSTYAKRSVSQQQYNALNLCGFHGSQWSSNHQLWYSQCQTMSRKDLQYRLSMRDRFLTQCPVVEYAGVGRNRQMRLMMALLRATDKQDVRLVKTLLSEGVNLSTQPQYLHASPLYIATRHNNLTLAKVLIKNGAKPYLLAKGEENLLTVLIRQGKTNYAFLEFLLKHRANPNVINQPLQSEYPLTIAASKGDFRAVNLLLNYDANPNLYIDRSALQHAVEQDHFPIVRSLIEQGANPNLGHQRQYCSGVTALDLAFRNARDRVIDLLLDNRALSSSECRKTLT